MADILKKYGWDQEKIQHFRADLLAWYDEHKRDLPWRRNNNPYYIWVSEIMLQQTQVTTVIPYFERFIEALPTIEALARVEDEALMSLWQGLGYYSRARNLKIAAQQVMNQFGGQMPETIEQISSLKGIGPYTAGAIASMAFNLPEPAIDGNLMRVTARIFELEADISKAGSRKIFEEILKELIDPDRPGDFNQALMDLGATVMTPTNYYPENSPIKAYDASFLNETSHKYPVKSQKIKATHHYFNAYLLENEKGEILMHKHGDGQLLKGLWHFPLVEVERSMLKEDTDFVERFFDHFPQFKDHLSLALDKERLISLNSLPLVKHVFSHRVWHLRIVPFKIKGLKECHWDEQSDWSLVPFHHGLPISTLQKKLLARIEEGRL